MSMMKRKMWLPARRVRPGMALLLMVLLASLLAPTAQAAPTPPAKSGAAPESVTATDDAVVWQRWGLDFSTSSGPRAIAVGAQVGAQLGRLWLSWERLEPVNTTPDNYNWPIYDDIIRQAVAAGMVPTVMISNCPAWACAFGNGPITRTPLSEFVELTDALVRHYSVAPYNVHVWEFFNEPDGTGRPNADLNWGNHGGDYAAMLRAVVPRMRAIDPSVKTAMGGLAYDWFTNDPFPGPFNRNFLRDVLAAGGGAYLDYIPFHHYISNIHWPTIGAKADELRSIVAEYGFTGQVLCNETGFSSAPELSTPRWGPNNEEIQARYLTQTFIQASASNMPGVVWFSVLDGETLDGIYSPFALNGLAQADGTTRKMSFFAYRTGVQEVGNSAYLRRLSDAETGNSNVEAHLFAGADPSKPVAVIWSNTHSSYNVRFNQADVRRVLDMTGNVVNGTPDGSGGLILSVGEDPFYVEYNSVQRFTDVPTDAYMFQAVNYLAGRAAISGYSDGTFRPFANATRGQVAKILTVANGWAIDTTGGPHFRDVSRNNSFYSYVETAFNKGVISGYGDGTFRPGDNITRGQLSKVIVLSRDWQPATESVNSFSDVSASNPFHGFIETAYRKGIISGYSDGTFRWGANATRGQIAKIVYMAVTGSTSTESVKSSK